MTFAEPVLVIAFNRPDHLSVLMDRLREVQPSQLFIAVDGPRPHKAGELERVQACRDLATTVDWSCDVQTNFQNDNLGCGLGVSTAISWFFDNVDRGVILEDDIIPDPSFFPYCEELLDRYENDERVFAISGCNFVPAEHQSHPELPYRFSQVPHIWGWATWQRSWAKHRLDIAGWREVLPVKTLWSRVGHSIPSTVYWTSTFELLARKEVDTWDGQLVLAAMAEDAWTATSNVNLIENIGFNEQATHTTVDRQELQPVESIRLPMVAVPVGHDSRADSWTRQHHFQATWRGMLGQAERYVKGRKRRAS
ncbi:MAG: hypothetical protein WAO50_11150 [Candidatus Nanopelagicales bacterium]